MSEVSEVERSKDLEKLEEGAYGGSWRAGGRRVGGPGEEGT